MSNQLRGFGSLTRGKFESGIGRFEKALIEAGRDPAEIIELMDTNADYCRHMAEFAARGAVSLPASYNLAQHIMGDNIFGIDEWASLYGATFTRNQVRRTSRFPWSEEILDSECPFNQGRPISETHFAFLGLESLNGSPLTISQWQQIHPADDRPRFWTYLPNCWHQNEKFANVPTCGLRWYLCLKEVVPGSTNKNWSYMQTMLKPRYEVPSPVIETTKVILFHRRNGKYLNNVWAACNVLDSYGGRVVVGYYHEGGLLVYDWSEHPRGHIGLGALRN